MPSGSSSSASNGSSNNVNNAVIDGDGSAYHKPKNIIDAVSEIQQFYVFETNADKDIPSNIFTFRQVVDFFIIGFRGAIVESLIFLLVFPVALTAYPAAKVYFFGTVPTIYDYLLPLMLSYSQIVIMTIYVMSAARFYKGGTVTRKAIHSLFTGRSVGFAIKACVGWFLLTLLYIKSYTSPDLIYTLVDISSRIFNIFLPNHAKVSADLLYAFHYQQIVPSLRSVAEDVLITMLILAAIPFCTLFAYGGWRYVRLRAARKAFEKYLAPIKLGLFPKRRDGLHLGIGWSIHDYRKEKLIDLWQMNANRKGHTFIAGATRVGKTRALQSMIIQDIEAGRSTAFIDPKGDWEIFSAIVQAAYRAGRQDELLFASPYYPQHSISINVLSHYAIEEELINHIVAGVPDKDQFFHDVAYETTSIVVRTLMLQKRHEDIKSGQLTFEEVYIYASHAGMLRCKDIVKPLVDIEPEAKTILTMIESVLQNPPDYFSKISNTLKTTLTQMTIGQTGKIMGSAKDNQVIERLESGKRVIFYAQTGSMLTNQVSEVMSRVLVSMFQALAGRLFSRNQILKIPLCLYMDEFSNMVYRGIENFFNKAGGGGFYLTAATQSLADVEAKITAERARMVFDNTNTKLFMRVNDLQTAQTLAAYGGVKYKYSYVFSSNGGVTTRETEEDVIKPDEFLNLKPREFFYFGIEGRFFGKTAPIAPSEIEMIVGEKPSHTTVKSDDEIVAEAATVESINEGVDAR